MEKEIIINIEKTILPWMGKTSKAIDYFLDDKLKEGGIELTKVQLVLLKKLREMDGQPQNNLAFLTNRDKASLARLITTMEKKKPGCQDPLQVRSSDQPYIYYKTWPGYFKESGPDYDRSYRSDPKGYP